jgi:carbamoyl-phosphate synthase small subunit
VSNTLLLLSDGSWFPGNGFGSPAPLLDDVPKETSKNAAGEVVFNTSMSGYHEMVTDPSYAGQILVFTSVHIGNYGCDEDWSETGVSINRNERFCPKAAAVVVRNLYSGPIPAGRISFSHFLESYGICGICGVDTRALTISLRDGGSRNGMLFRLNDDARFPSDSWLDGALKRVRAIPSMEGQALARKSGTEKGSSAVEKSFSANEAKVRVALIDYGVKGGIIRELKRCGSDVVVLSSVSTAEEVLSLHPDGVLLSNGPGDPAVLDREIATVAGLVGKVPVFGICLGHQLLATALGGKTRKMAFGHHGANHPVREMATERVYVTSQNHGFEVDPDSLPEDVVVSHVNANDGSVEGIIHKHLAAASVQFHPEASPGPREATILFDRWIDTLLQNKNEVHP